MNPLCGRMMVAAAGLALCSQAATAEPVQVGQKADKPAAWATAQLDEFAALNAFAEAALEKFFDVKTGKPCVPFHHGIADDVVEGMSAWDRFTLLSGSDAVRGGMIRVWQYIYDELVRTGDFKDGFYSKGYDAEHTGELYQMLFACMEMDPANPALAEANRKIADVIIGRCYNKETRLLHHPILSTTGGHERKNNPYVDELLNGLYILNAFRAYMTAGDEKYRAWALEYGGKWNELAAANNGVLPFLADSKTGKVGDPWWGTSSFSYKVYGLIVAGRYMQGWPTAMVMLDGGNAKHLSGLAGTVEAMFKAGKDGLPMTKIDESGWSRDKASWFVPKLLDRQYCLTFDPAVLERIKAYHAAAGKAAKDGDKSAATEEQFLNWLMFLYCNQFDLDWAAQRFANGASAARTRLEKLGRLTTMPETGDQITEQVQTRPGEIGLVDGSFFGDYDNQRAGAPATASIGYWRSDNIRGLPAGVAALVRNVNKDGVHLLLCNTADQPATLTLVGGFYGQHRIESIVEGDKTHKAAARTVQITLPGKSQADLDVELTRFAFRPTLTPLAATTRPN